MKAYPLGEFEEIVLLISGAYLVYQQITFMKNQDLGVDMEKILVVNGPRVGLNTGNLESRIQTFKNKAVSHHSISSVSSTGSVPGKLYNERTEVRKMGEPADANQQVNIVNVDVAFPKTYDLRILAGKFFTETELAGQKQAHIIINEEAVKVFGLGSVEDALGEKLTGNGENAAEIIGVVKNVHWTSLRDTYSPVIFLHNKWVLISLSK